MGGLGAKSTPPAADVARYEILGELGVRPRPTRIARHLSPGGKASLVVVERFEGVLRGGGGEGAVFLDRARRIAALAHPNLAGVREVSVSGDDAVVASAFLDGEKLSQLWDFDRECMPLDVGLHILLGVLTGLGALHRVCDHDQQPMRLAHGEIAPTTILFGIDGVARVLHAVARQAPNAEPEAASLDWLAPEARAHQPCDERTDVFGVGVLLWELLSRRRMRVGGAATDAPLASAPEGAPWANELVDVAARALRPVPGDRWPTAAAMAAQIHHVAGTRVASLSAAAAWFGSLAGERVRARRLRLESASVPDASQSVVLPKPSIRVVGANTRGRAKPRAATLPLIQLADVARALGAEQAAAEPSVAPSDSKVQLRQPAPEPARPMTPRDGAEPEDTTIDVIPAYATLTTNADPPPSRIDRSAERAPRDPSVPNGLSMQRRPGRAAACIVAVVAAIAFGVGVAAYGHARAARPAMSPEYLAPSGPSLAADLSLFASPRLNSRALPEPSLGATKGAPPKRAPSHPGRSRPAPAGR